MKIVKEATCSLRWHTVKAYLTWRNKWSNRGTKRYQISKINSKMADVEPTLSTDST